MRKGGSKQKGAEFERLVCEKLSRWVQPETDQSLFWRSSMSGGRATIRRGAGKKSEKQSGDICAIDPAGAPFLNAFTVECKHVKTLNLQSAMINGYQEVAVFWRQVSRDAAHSGKKPLLIARQNLSPILAFGRMSDLVARFGPISKYERARLFMIVRPGTEPVSMFILTDLLKAPYEEARFVQQLSVPE